MKKSMKYGIYSLIGLLFLINFGLAIWLWVKGQETQKIPSFHAENCDLNQQACSVTFLWQGQTHTAQLTLAPQPIPIAKPLNVGVEFDSPIPWQSVHIEITGLNMYMGFNRQALSPISPSQWTGQSILAFCTENAMQWQVQIQLTDEKAAPLALNFVLNTLRK